MREAAETQILAKIDIEMLNEGPVLQPLTEWTEEQMRVFEEWETPLAPRGAFQLDSGISVVTDEGGKVLQWGDDSIDRALVTGGPHWRDYSIKATLLPLSKYASSNEDRNDWREALCGIVFRMVTSRQYYLFGVEGWRRLALYGRNDDEWFLLETRDVEIPDQYLSLEVHLDGDAIRCIAQELGVQFFLTDVRFPSGKAGIRSMGRCRVGQLEIRQTRGQRKESRRRHHLDKKRTELLGKDLPQAVLLQTMDVRQLGGVPQFVDLREEGRFEMLITAPDRLRFLSKKGELIWEIPKPAFAQSFSDPMGDQGRLLCVVTGVRTAREEPSVLGYPTSWVVGDELMVIAGRTGQILATAPIPDMAEEVVRTDLCHTGGSLTGPGKTDFLLREWRSDVGHGGYLLMAMDKDLQPLWQRNVDTPYGHGHAVQFYDVDGDGRDELLAGGTLYSCTGEMLWQHDLIHEMSTITGAQHYDAVLVGHLSDDPEVDPVAFLLGGSAGVYVVDGLTGITRMVHRVGHAQGRQSLNLRADLPGTEVLVSCRWGNMGIQTLFSGRGDRLWSIQPDYVGQGSCPVSWGERKSQLLWVNTSRKGMGLFDGYGRKVLDLPKVKALWDNAFKRDISCFAAKIGLNPRDHLCILKEENLYIFGQE